MSDDGSLMMPLRGSRRRKPVNRLGIVIVLTAILGISSSICYAAISSPPPIHDSSPVIHKISLHKPIPTLKPAPTSTPIVVPTTTPVSTPTTTNMPLPVLNAPLFGGNTELPEVALTFDDGPNPYYTPQILSILQQYNVKATFFDIGYLAQDYPKIVRQEFEAGHIVADHSWSHPTLTSLSAQAVYSQLSGGLEAIQAATGARPAFFRPPYGSYNSVVLAQARSLGLSTIIWNVDPSDWSLPGTGAIVSRVLDSVGNGKIILLHDGGGFRAQTVAALPTIITALRSRGYSFVTIDEMVRHLGGYSNAAPVWAVMSKGHVLQSVTKVVPGRIGSEDRENRKREVLFPTRNRELHESQAYQCVHHEMKWRTSDRLRFGQLQSERW